MKRHNFPHIHRIVPSFRLYDRELIHIPVLTIMHFKFLAFSFPLVPCTTTTDTCTLFMEHVQTSVEHAQS